MAFYMWDQNNSGGSFVVNENLSHRVVIEAKNKEEAESKASYFGIYYDGVEEGIDCKCCGDRWYKDYYELDCEGMDTYLQNLADEYGWEDPDIIVHYLDGTKKTFTGNGVTVFAGERYKK